MNDIDMPATKLEALRFAVAYAALALLILWAGWRVIVGDPPIWMLRLAAFWLLGGFFNKTMRVLLAAISVLQAIIAVEKHARRAQR